MTDRPPVEIEATPPGEHIHMPGPSILPLINAASLAAGIVMITLSWWLCGFFMLIWIISTIVWIRTAARETAELPLEHH